MYLSISLLGRWAVGRGDTSLYSYACAGAIELVLFSPVEIEDGHLERSLLKKQALLRLLNYWQLKQIIQREQMWEYTGEYLYVRH